MSFLDKRIFQSVIFQILMAMTLIAGMALASMSLSVYVTMRVQDDAEAINLAGSLRMHAYRMGYTLAQPENINQQSSKDYLKSQREQFANKLYQSSMAELIEQSSNTPLEASYRQVISNWRNEMEPILIALETDAAGWEQSNTEYSRHLAQYVDAIDYMVTLLQRNTEGKIELLGMTEGVSIFLIILTVVFFVMKADSNFAVPLRSLVRGAEKVEQGDLSHRINYSADNELGALSHSFDKMTASLEDQYRTLEQQVAERTVELRKSNQAIYFLYKTSREIASSPYDQTLLGAFLADLQQVTGVEAISLCVNAEPSVVNYERVIAGDHTKLHCDSDCQSCEFSPSIKKRNTGFALSLELKNRDDTYGFLYIKSADGERLSAWQLQLLNTVAETLSTSFAFHHTLGQERRVILHEERSTIARELHDSLAQSLSYMKMETARLKTMIERGFEKEQIAAAMEDLQLGVNASYKHLRELLVTFRTKLDAPDLRNALEHAVEEFSGHTTADISLDYALQGFALGPNEDIHVLHILREGLNNAVKHAEATQISVKCAGGPHHELVFAVEDDGVGLPADPERAHHYGLFTMQERARQLNGKLCYTRLPTGGTRIELRMTPAPNMLRT